MPRMTMTAYSRHRMEKGLRGKSVSAVHQAISNHRISLGPDGLLDSDEADAEWERNTNHIVGGGITGGSILAGKTPELSDKSDYNASKTAREFYEANLAKLKFEEKKGQLIPVGTVKKVLYEAGRVIRAGHENLIAQLAPDLAAETRIPFVEKTLKTALNDLDTRLSEKIRNIEDLVLTELPEDEELTEDIDDPEG